MFSRATSNFVRQIDPEGSLIHVSRLNDSHKLVPMALVVKRNRFWFWQRPKFHPSDFTLSDLLLGNKPLSPAVSESDFLTYQGAFGDNLRGRLDAKAGVISINLEGRGSSKLQSSFGKLRRQQVDVKKLLLESSDRLVDMQHVLVQQLEKRAEVLAVLKERILTTSPCSITQTQHKQGTCGGVLGLVDKLGSTVEVCVKENGSMELDSDVSMEIPPGTVIAYSLLELEIKKDGHYEPCLQPGILGGFEADSGTSSPSHDPFDLMDMVDGPEGSQVIPEGAPLSVLHNEELEKSLRSLADLPQSTRSVLFQNFHEVLEDRAALSTLEHILEEWCRGESPVTTELSVNQNNSACVLLDLLRPNQANHIDTGGLGMPRLLTAAHLLVSAMEALPDAALGLLRKSSPDVLVAFNTLITRLKSSCESLPIESLPLPLQDDKAFHWAEQLLNSSNVKMRRETGRLWAETGNKPGVLPLVLCVTVQGLSALCAGQK